MQLDESQPLWRQLVADFSHCIVSGTWAPGSKIPSVRDLAMHASVNPNTVQRALSELDRTGLTTTQRTAGRFVTTDNAVIDAARNDLATQATDAYLTSMRRLGLNHQHAVDILDARWRALTNEGED